MFHAKRTCLFKKERTKLTECQVMKPVLSKSSVFFFISVADIFYFTFESASKNI